MSVAMIDYGQHHVCMCLGIHQLNWHAQHVILMFPFICHVCDSCLGSESSQMCPDMWAS